jgi:hypothetical protein
MKDWIGNHNIEQSSKTDCLTIDITIVIVVVIVTATHVDVVMMIDVNVSCKMMRHLFEKISWKKIDSQKIWF